jgi:hypothetical protein
MSASIATAAPIGRLAPPLLLLAPIMQDTRLVGTAVSAEKLACCRAMALSARRFPGQELAFLPRRLHLF